MRYYVYKLKSLKDNKHYIGFTNNLKRRIEEHNKGKVCSTKNRRPFELVSFKTFKTAKEAIRYEKKLKNK